MKNSFIFVFCSMIFFTLSLKSQEKFAIIDLNKNFETGLSEANYYQVFKLSGDLNQKQIDDFKENSLKYNHVVDVVIVKTSDAYDVKVLLEKETEQISGFFRDYLLSVSINKLVIDNKKINTVDYYSVLSQKINHKETSK